MAIDRNEEHSAVAHTDEAQQHRTDTRHAGDDAHRSASGRGWHGDSEGHAAAGRKGGQKVARNKEHMASIGRKGGEAVSKNREHMAAIGRKGGQARGEGTRK
jgi:uncharacterized protein